MKRFDARGLSAALAAATLTLATACSDASEADSDGEITDASTTTLATSLSEIPDMAALNSAISVAEIGSIFDGPASYTLLAPNDPAFEKLGDTSSDLMQDENRALLVAILRDHILPGHLTPEAIGDAIDAKGGPVTVTSLGETSVTFSRNGDGISVETSGGSSASVSGSATAASNGVIIPVDNVLLPGEAN